MITIMKHVRYGIITVGICFLFFLLFTSERTYKHIETIETKKTPEDLWATITRIAHNSNDMQFPNNLMNLNAAELKLYKPISVNYHTPFGTSKNEYDITFLRYGILEVKNNKGPFLEKGSISVIPRPDGSAVSWSIEYTYRLINPFGWYGAYRYFPQFFSQLRFP